MRVHDTLIKVKISQQCENTREQNGLIYAYCHERNIVAKKNNEIVNYFVFSNHIDNFTILKRSTVMEDTLDGVSVTYDTEKYSDFIFFQGLKNDDGVKFKLSNDFTRFIFNQTTLGKIKKVIATSNGGQRPISICRTEFRNIANEVITQEKYLYGFGARLSYGCGLLIPTKVYNHLLNFVK